MRFAGQVVNRSSIEAPDADAFLRDMGAANGQPVSVEIYAGDISPQALDSMKCPFRNADSREKRVCVIVSAEGRAYSVSAADREWRTTTELEIADRLKTVRSYSYWPDTVSVIVGAVLGFLAWFAAASFWYRRMYDAKLRAKDPAHQRTPIVAFMRGSNLSPSLADVLGMKSPPMAWFWVALCFAVGLGFVGFRFATFLFPYFVFLVGAHVAEYERLSRLRFALMGIGTGLVALAGVAFVAMRARRKYADAGLSGDSPV